MMVFKESFHLCSMHGVPPEAASGEHGVLWGHGPFPSPAVNAAVLMYQAAVVPRASLTGGGKLPLQSRGWRLPPLLAT